MGISTFLLVKGAIGALKASAVKSTAAGAAKLVVTNPTASSTLLVSIKSTLVGAGKYAAAKVTAGATAAAASGAVGGTAALLAVGASYGGIRLTKSIVNNSKRFVKALSKGDYESAIIHVFEVLKEGGSACDVSEIFEAAIADSSFPLDKKDTMKQVSRQLTSEVVSQGIDRTNTRAESKVLAKRIAKEITAKVV